MAYRETARVRRRKAATRDNLLTSAEALVREGGFGALTVQGLAFRAGVGVGTVYRYFPGKDDLAAEVFRRVTDREVAAVSRAMEVPGEPLSALGRGLSVFADRALRARTLARALIAEPVSAALDSERLRYRRAWAELFRAPLREALDLELVPPQQPSLTAAALVGALAEALIGPLAGDEPADTLIPSIHDFCMRAVGAEVNHERED